MSFAIKNWDLNITSKNFEELLPKLFKSEDDYDVIYCEVGEDFQEYSYEDGSCVPQDTPIGFEDSVGNLHLFDDIYFKD